MFAPMQKCVPIRKKVRVGIAGNVEYVRILEDAFVAIRRGVHQQG